MEKQLSVIHDEQIPEYSTTLIALGRMQAKNKDCVLRVYAQITWERLRC